MKATYDGVVIAESNETIVVEGNYYFPVDSVKKEFLRESGMRTLCPWKGEASYYNIEVHGKLLKNAAWYYPDPGWLAKKVKDRVAFDDPIEVVE